MCRKIRLNFCEPKFSRNSRSISLLANSPGPSLFDFFLPLTFFYRPTKKKKEKKAGERLQGGKRYLDFNTFPSRRRLPSFFFCRARKKKAQGKFFFCFEKLCRKIRPSFREPKFVRKRRLDWIKILKPPIRARKTQELPAGIEPRD